MARKIVQDVKFFYESYYSISLLQNNGIYPLVCMRNLLKFLPILFLSANLLAQELNDSIAILDLLERESRTWRS